MSGTRNLAFAVSQDLDVALQVKIGSLEGRKALLKWSQTLSDPTLSQIESNIASHSDLLVSLQVVDVESGRNLTLPVFTRYVPFRGRRVWNHWVTLPIQIKQLDMNSHLAIGIWEYNGSRRVPFFRLQTSVFNSADYSLKRGFESIKFDYNDPTSLGVRDEQLNAKLNKYYLGEFKRTKWLDDLTLMQLNREKSDRQWPMNEFVLNIQFPVFELPIVFTPSLVETTQSNIPTLDNYEHSKDPLVMQRSSIEPGIRISLGDKYNSTLKFYDPDQFNYDPIEEKFRRLERATKHVDLDKQLKPNTKKRDYLNKIIDYPPGKKLTSHEKGSIWKYRYYLMNNKKALTKLLQSTNLKVDSERTEVFELLDMWVEIDIDDAIELLGPNFKSLSVRSYAVNRLKKASDKELELYLLQLVQAISFENISSFSERSSSEFTVIGTRDSNSQHMISSVRDDLQTTNNTTIGAGNAEQNNNDQVFNDQDNNSIPIVISPLAEFLIRRAINNSRLGNYFYWYLKSESDDTPYLRQILESFWSRLQTDHRQLLVDQIKFITLLNHCCVEVKMLKDSTNKKTELLNELLSTKVRQFLKNKPLPLPLDPDVIVVDVVPERSKVFKSSLSPLMITFNTEDSGIYQLMYKVGDDLRQDQLVIQIIRLMDELLKNENVDLKLTPYKALATGPQEGAIQFVPTDTMANILSTYHGVLPFFKKHHPDPNAELGVQESVMDTFVKSCAGYCVITYILGVGDRHLDNLLISPDGHFFHADFGYILGQDPKPFPPLMKLPPQIVEAFGGVDSLNYNKFRSYCFVSYSILRRNAGLILNLFELMKTSNIPDIRVDPEGAILKVKERFNLDMSEEDATVHFQTLINNSVNALLPIVIDHLHNLAQYWRA